MKIRRPKHSYPTWQEGFRDIHTIFSQEPTFDITLNTGTASTTITNVFAGINSVVTFMPTNLGAAQALSGLYVKTRDKQKFIIAHETATSTRTFSISIEG